MRDALKRAGLDSRRFAQGDVWTVSDSAISLPETPRGQNERTMHASRTVIILDGPERCQDGSLISILAVPTSTRRDLASRYRITIPEGEGSLEESVAMVDLIQPMLRSAFLVKMGELSREKLFEVLSVLLDNLGVLPKAADDPFEGSGDETEG